MLETFEQASLDPGIMSKFFLKTKTGRLEDISYYSFQHSTQICLEEMEKATKLAPKQRLNPMPLHLLTLGNYQVDKPAINPAELLRMGLEMVDQKTDQHNYPAPCCNVNR